MVEIDFYAQDTPLHRAPAWFKIALLAVTGTVTVLVLDPVTSLGLMAASLLLLVSTVPPARATTRGMLGIAVVAIMSVLFHVWRGDLVRAVDTSADLVAIAALALAVTSSTPAEAMLAFVARALQPLRRIVPPETIALMFTLLLRVIPEMARILFEARSAARARGLDRSARAVLVPAATRTVGFALDLGQALHARGIAESAPEAVESPQILPRT